MRLTFKFSTAGESHGFASMPALSHSGDWYRRPNGSLDTVRIMADLASQPGISTSQKDGLPVFALAAEFLDRVHVSFRNLADEMSGIAEKRRGEPTTSAERRLRRGKFACVRTDISCTSSGFRIALATGNPNGAVGAADEFAAIMAQFFADTWIAIRDDLGDRTVPFRLVEGDGCAGVFGRAVRRNRREAVRRANDCRLLCASHRNGFCSPFKPSCPHFRAGSCVALDPDDTTTPLPPPPPEAAK